MFYYTLKRMFTFNHLKENNTTLILRCKRTQTVREMNVTTSHTHTHTHTPFLLDEWMFLISTGVDVLNVFIYYYLVKLWTCTLSHNILYCVMCQYRISSRAPFWNCFFFHHTKSKHHIQGFFGHSGAKTLVGKLWISLTPCVLCIEKQSRWRKTTPSRDKAWIWKQWETGHN